MQTYEVKYTHTLEEFVEKYGVRGAAEQLGVVPSNVVRWQQNEQNKSASYLLKRKRGSWELITFKSKKMEKSKS